MITNYISLCFYVYQSFSSGFMMHQLYEWCYDNAYSISATMFHVFVYAISTWKSYDKFHASTISVSSYNNVHAILILMFMFLYKLYQHEWIMNIFHVYQLHFFMFFMFINRFHQVSWCINYMNDVMILFHGK